MAEITTRLVPATHLIYRIFFLLSHNCITVGGGGGGGGHTLVWKLEDGG